MTRQKQGNGALLFWFWICGDVGKALFEVLHDSGLQNCFHGVPCGLSVFLDPRQCRSGALANCQSSGKTLLQIVRKRRAIHPGTTRKL